MQAYNSLSPKSNGESLLNTDIRINRYDFSMEENSIRRASNALLSEGADRGDEEPRDDCQPKTLAYFRRRTPSFLPAI